VASEIKSPDKLADNEIYADKPETTAKAGNPMSDMWITSAVKMRLMADERTPALDVNVDTTDGAVTLFGMVPSGRRRRRRRRRPQGLGCEDRREPARGGGEEAGDGGP
jgi:osmotically-inducible protein OsmY